MRENRCGEWTKGAKTRFSGVGKEDLEFVEVSYALRKPYEIGVFRIVIGSWTSNEGFLRQCASVVEELAVEGEAGGYAEATGDLGVLAHPLPMSVR